MGKVLLMTKIVIQMLISRVEVIRRVYKGMRLNSKGQLNGKVLRCCICDRTKDIMKNCQHKEEQDEVNINVQITFLDSKPQVMQRSLVLDSLEKGLKGSGWSKVMAGHT